MNLIPFDIYFEITKNLNIYDIKNMSRINKKFLNYSKNENLWKIKDLNRLSSYTHFESIKIQHNIKIYESSWLSIYTKGNFAYSKDQVKLQLTKDTGYIFTQYALTELCVNLSNFISDLKLLQIQRRKLYLCGNENELEETDIPKTLHLLTNKILEKTGIINLEEEYKLYRIRNYTKVVIRDYCKFNTMKEEYGTLVLSQNNLGLYYIIYFSNLPKLIDELTRILCIIS